MMPTVAREWGVRAGRLDAQLLGAARAATPEQVVQRLLAVQAQDARAFRLAVRARSTVASSAEVDAALTARRSLVVSWLCRGTLHLVGAADYWWLHALTAPRLRTANLHRLAQLGVDPVLRERGIQVVLGEVAAGPRTRAELGAAMADAGVPTAGQALVHVLFAASIEAHLVRGPVRGGEHCFVDAERWLGPPPGPLDRDAALRRLAARYLGGHAPASADDLAAYAGLGLTDARRAFALAADERGDESPDPSPDTDAPAPPPRLLGMFDPVLHGWRDRGWVVRAQPGVVTSNGLFRATALVDGEIAGVWTLAGGAVNLRPLRPVSPRALAELEAEAAGVLQYLGQPPVPLSVLA